MKHSACIFATFILLAICSAAAGFAAEQSSDLDIYYPLTPRTITYDCVKKGSKDVNTREVVVHKPLIQNGIEVTPSAISGYELKYKITRFIQRTQDGVYAIAVQIGDTPLSNYSIKVPLFKVPVKTGTFFDSDVKLTSADGGASVTGHHTYSIEDTSAVVKVPYGVLTNCVRMKFIVRVGDRVNAEITSWLAPKIGVARIIEVSKSNQGGEATEIEMTLKKIDYNVPAATAQAPPPAEKKPAATTQATSPPAKTTGPFTDPIARMKGVDFLVVYIAIIAGGLILGWKYIRNADPTADELPLPPPLNPDPYEVAYLRGGIQEVIRLTVFRLIQARSLVGEGLKIARADGSVAPSTLSDMERIVYQALDTPLTTRALCKLISPEFKERCVPLDQRLRNERLLTSQTAIDRARKVKIALLCVVLLLGGYKLVVALATGHTNVLFLILSAVIGTILIFKISRTPWLSRKGAEYLKQLQAKSRGEQDISAPNMEIEDSGLTLMVALFGFGVLEGTAYAQYANALAMPRSSSFDSYVYTDTGSGDTGGFSGGGSDIGGGGCGGCGGGSD